MRTCEVRKPSKLDDEMEELHPELKARNKKRKDDWAVTADALIDDARRLGRVQPDRDEILARIQRLQNFCSPVAPRQKVILYLSDSPPFFRATTVQIPDTDEE